MIVRQENDALFHHLREPFFVRASSGEECLDGKSVVSYGDDSWFVSFGCHPNGRTTHITAE